MKYPPFIKNHTATLKLITLHIIFFSSSVVATKAISVSVEIIQLIFARSLVTLAFVLASRKSRTHVMASLQSDAIKILMLRASTGFFGVYGVFHTIVSLPISIAMTIIGTTPIFVIAIESLVLNQKIRLEIYGYSALTALGIYISTSEPSGIPESHIDNLNVFVGLISSLLVSVSFVSVKYSAEKVGTTAVVFWFGLGMFVGSISLGGRALLVWSPTLREILGIVAICALGTMSDLTKTSAYRLAPSWIVSLLSLLSIPIAAILAHILFDERLSLLQIAGIVLMLASISIAIYRG